MLNNPIRLGLLALILVPASCTPIPDLEPKVEYVEIAKQINQASLIVVGIVEREKVVRAAKDPNSLELRQVTVLVEATLEGLFKEKQLTFYYFGGTERRDRDLSSLKQYPNISFDLQAVHHFRV